MQKELKKIKKTTKEHLNSRKNFKSLSHVSKIYLDHSFDIHRNLDKLQNPLFFFSLKCPLPCFNRAERCNCFSWKEQTFYSNSKKEEKKTSPFFFSCNDLRPSLGHPIIRLEWRISGHRSGKLSHSLKCVRSGSQVTRSHRHHWRHQRLSPMEWANFEQK